MATTRTTFLVAAVVTTGAAVALLSTPKATVNPSPLVRVVGFANADGSFDDDGSWTNFFQFAALTSSNLQDWNTNFPTFQIINGHIGFVFTDSDALFVRGMFLPTNQ